MDEKFTDQILDYLNGQLDANEQKTFEKELATNKALAEEVELYKDLYNVHEVIGDDDLVAAIQATTEQLENKDFFRQTASELALENKTTTSQKETTEAVVKELKPNRFRLRPLLSIAASLLLLLAVGTWWSSNNYSNQSLAQSQFSEIGMSNFVRGNRNPATDPFVEGAKALKAKDYAKASIFFQNIPSTSPAYNEAKLYLALAQFKSGDYANALTNADFVANNSQKLGQKAKWLKVNILLANGETGATFQSLLSEIANDAQYPFYQKQAKALQEKLASPWRRLVF